MRTTPISTKIRTTIIALVAAFSFAASMAPTASQAAPINDAEHQPGVEQPRGGKDQPSERPNASNTYQCTQWVGNTCMRRTCTAGDMTTCGTFATNCALQGHHYEGSSTSGACTRGRLA